MKMSEVKGKFFLVMVMAALLVMAFQPSMIHAATDQVNENSSMDEVQAELDKYLVTTEEGSTYFDVKAAMNNNESDFLIRSGIHFNELSQSYTLDGKVGLAWGLPIWGNWCGPGHGGGTPIDLLDTACMYHDLDYAKYGYFHCASDLRLINRINMWYSSMGTAEKAMAIAVRTYFQAQTAIIC